MHSNLRILSTCILHRDIYIYIYIYIYICVCVCVCVCLCFCVRLGSLIHNFVCVCEYHHHHHHHHHHVVPPARISLTLSRHFSLLFIASGRSSGLHPVSSHSCCTYVRAGRPAFAWPYAGVHQSTSLMSSSLHLQQCPACLVRLTCIVFVILFTNPSARTGYDTRSIFKLSSTGLNNWIHTFPKGISAMWNAISLVQDLNSCRRVHFLRR